MKKFSFIMTILMCFLLLAGCSKEISEKNTAIKNIKYENTNYEVPKNPQKVVVLANSLLYMINELGANESVVGRTETMDKLPENLEKISTVGHTSHINTEALISLKPDLVLGLNSQHAKLSPLLNENKIPNMLVNYDGINDNIPLLLALGQVFNKENEAQKAVENYKTRLNKVNDAIKKVKPARVAVLFATGKAISAETSRAIAASMTNALKMEDVVAPHITNEMKNSKYIPYSLETLTLDNPDVIFIVSMGKRSDINEQMKKSMTDNPAWNQLKAVKNDKVFYLPSELFLLNPGLKTPEAMAELVKYAYGIDVNF